MDVDTDVDAATAVTTTDPPVARVDDSDMAIDTVVGAAAQPAPKNKCQKRYSGGPQAKRRVKQYHNERQSNTHLAVVDASQSAPDGSEVDGGV